MAVLNLTVCDKCGDLERPAQTWAIHGPDNSYKIDLCDEHGQELIDCIKALSPNVKPIAKRTAPRRTPTRRQGDFITRVATIEEIEAQKKARNTTASKR